MNRQTSSSTITELRHSSDHPCKRRCELTNIDNPRYYCGVDSKFPLQFSIPNFHFYSSSTHHFQLRKFAIHCRLARDWILMNLSCMHSLALLLLHIMHNDICSRSRAVILQLMLSRASKTLKLCVRNFCTKEATLPLPCSLEPLARTMFYKKRRAWGRMQFV
jgi:hypothetical protein